MKTTFKNILLTTMLAATYTASAMAVETATPAHSYADKSINGPHNISVTISNIKSETGYIMAALFDSKDTYLGSDIVRAERIAISGSSVTFSYADLPQGEYAITVFHDEDSDGKLATGMFGIPSEPYGFSNDAPVRFGPPKWSKAKFSVGAGNAVQSINLR